MDAFAESPFFRFLERAEFPNPARRPYLRERNTRLQANHQDRYHRRPANNRATWCQGQVCRECPWNDTGELCCLSTGAGCENGNGNGTNHQRSVSESAGRNVRYGRRVCQNEQKKHNWRAPMSYLFNERKERNFEDVDLSAYPAYAPWKTSDGVTELYENTDYEDATECEAWESFGQGYESEDGRRSRQASGMQRAQWEDQNLRRSERRDFKKTESAGYSDRTMPRETDFGRRPKDEPNDRFLDWFYLLLDADYDSQVHQDSHIVHGQEPFYCPREDVSGESRVSVRTPRFVDRGVDRDSLSNVSRSSKSESLVESIVDTEEAWEKSRSFTKLNENDCKEEFWEFIPLDGRSDQARSGMFDGRRSFGQTLRNEDWQGNSNRFEQDRLAMEYLGNSGLTDSTPFVKSGTGRIACTRKAQETTEHRKSRGTDSSEMTDAAGWDFILNENKSAHESVGKSSSVLKRTGCAAHPELSTKRQKTLSSTVEQRTADDEPKTKPSFLKSTSACLKRKLGSGKPKAVQSSGVRADRSAGSQEKRIRSESSTCSRLPVRIGPRMRSRDPSVRSVSGSNRMIRCEAQVRSESPERSSPRSRTKPKIRPSVVQVPQRTRCADQPPDGKTTELSDRAMA